MGKMDFHWKKQKSMKFINNPKILLKIGKSPLIINVWSDFSFFLIILR